MADQQKIHPARDVEAPPPKMSPTTPLVPRDEAKSENSNPAPVEYPPPLKRTLPAMQTRPPKRKSCCCRCLCWTVCLLLLQIVVLGIAAAILYAVFQPKLPKYSVDKLQITQFNLGSDSSLSAAFNVTITATNPNKKIGIYYEEGSSMSVYYTTTKLCEGSMPKFYQGHQNTTVLVLPLTGQTQNGAALITAVTEQKQQTGNIPLNLRVNQPVRIKLGKLKLMKVKFLVKCGLVVDSLSANNAISIRSSSCKFSLRL
ncbi:hypothetical protein SLEP1_g53998 [Rubroshorea leprosula]|uniref:Late embryogenesis abundant protein LEA-2 subgroup domain-containing protein n=1 Tax=Rubroshorea leprosula TaxID=152421 RepID=A0AAV5MBA5_9ROSI|nr:hypothetical protein SLEP1_g53998 [Rubroshorea leprosula]